MKVRTIFQVHRQPFARPGIQIYGGTEGANGILSVFTGVSIKDIDRYEVSEPFLNISEDSAQCLFDELYRAGFRPSREEQLTAIATNDHVADLRKIAFKLLDITSE